MPNIAHTTTKWSTYALTASFLAIIALVGSNEFFQIPRNSLNPPVYLENPIHKKLLEELSAIEITNSLGNYRLEKSQSTWHIAQPRFLLARKDLIDRILESLSSLNVHRLYEKDNINVQNFSLHKPILSIKLISDSHSAQNLTFGFLNSIDDSTYLATDHHPSLIYQVTSPEIPIHALSLNELIDSNIFKTSKDKIQQIQVKKFPLRRNSLKLNLIRNGSIWQTNAREKLDEERAKKWLEKLLSQKANIILDQRSGSLEKKITEEMNHPSYAVFIREDKGKEITYKISRPLSSLENIKLGSKKFILITSSLEGVPPVITDKSLLELLKIKIGRLVPPSPKKIFY